METKYNKAGKKIVRRMDDPKPKQKRRAGGGRKPISPNGEAKEMQMFRLRTDVIRTLKKMPKFMLFAEAAILEKLERENIPLI